MEEKFISIIGAGHLGLSLAKTFINNGYDKTKILLSYNKNPKTFERIKKTKLSKNISSNKEICANSKIIFITIPPGKINTLSSLQFNPKSLLVSCMAGIEINKIEKILNHKVIRIMPSSPTTLEEEKGICAIYPQNKIISKILSTLKISIYNLPNESLFHVFTASVCLPATYLQLGIKNIKFLNPLINLYKNKFPFFEKIIKWSYDITPKSLSTSEKNSYIKKMATKGGITEAIVTSIKKGLSLTQSLNNGIKRSKEISKM
jgi:pyrroline-5-carboxylate reductase